MYSPQLVHICFFVDDRYYLRVDRRDPAVKWNNIFLKLMENTSLGDGVEIAYSSSESLEQVRSCN